MFIGASNPAMAAALTSPPWFRQDRPYVWLDCDIGPDTDDMVHINLCIWFHKRGLINLVGLTASSYGPAHGPGLRSLLDANGLTRALVGVQPAPPQSNGFTAEVTFRYRPNETSATYPTAVQALRQGLASVPDKSLIMLNGGGQTAMKALLQSTASDGFDNRNGIDLVAAKVKLWSGMIGFINYSSEYNVELDRPAAVYVAANWPTPMIWVGGAFGGSSYIWPDPVVSNIDEWKTPSAYCAMRPINNVGWDIAAFWAALLNGGTFLWPRGVNGTVTIDPNSGLPTFVGNNGGNRSWYDLILGQKDIVGGRLTDLVNQMLPRNAALGAPIASFDFVAQSYIGGGLNDLVCTAPDGRTASNADGSTVTFGANQLRITNQGLFLVGDLIEIKGATFAAMAASKVTIVLQFATINSPGNGRMIACKNATNSNYYLLAHAANNVVSWAGSFSNYQTNACYLPAGQAWPCPAIAAYQTDGASVRVALNGNYSNIMGTPMPSPTNLYLGTDSSGGQSCTNTILTKLVVYADTLPAALLTSITVTH